MRWMMLLALAACGGGETAPEVPAGAHQVPFTSLNAFFGGERIVNHWTSGQARRVARNQAEWDQLYQDVTGRSPGPAISFTDQAVFFATTGLKIVTGNDIVIDEMWKDDGGKLYIVVRSIRPGTSCSAQTVTNSPVTAVLSISSYTGIAWIERQSVDPCTIS